MHARHSKWHRLQTSDSVIWLSCCFMFLAQKLKFPWIINASVRNGMRNDLNFFSYREREKGGKLQIAIWLSHFFSAANCAIDQWRRGLSHKLFTHSCEANLNPKIQILPLSFDGRPLHWILSSSCWWRLSMYLIVSSKISAWKIKK